MSDIPGTTPEYDREEKLVHAGYSAAIDAALAAIFKAAPYLALPVLKQVFTFVFNKITRKIYENLEITVADFIIHARVAGENQAYARALAELKPLLEAGDLDEKKKKALEEYRARLGKLIRIQPDLVRSN